MSTNTAFLNIILNDMNSKKIERVRWDGVDGCESLWRQVEEIKERQLVVNL